MPEKTTPIAETPNFIVLDKYSKERDASEQYQSEDDLERELVRDLQNQGLSYDFPWVSCEV